jgi:hypothetical protein
MKNIDRIEINKFSHLHNGKNIFFCKTDYILEDFKKIEAINHPVTLITGNSDYAITDEIVSLAPKNIIAWYAQNAVSNSNILHPIPIGLENKLPSFRNSHGIGYLDRASEKEKLLDETSYDNIGSKFIYANFNISTNYNYRSIVKQYCVQSSFIDWQESNLSLSNFFKTIQEYKMVVCPAGNGIDTHRLWEVLYSNRIPITIIAGDFKIYELYKKLPIILLNNIDQLLDKNFIIQEYNRCLSQIWDKSLLDVNSWIKIIQNKD